MLVLSRKVGERILIGEQIAVTVVRISGGGVRLGIQAPSELAVIREELKEAMDLESSSSESSQDKMIEIDPGIAELGDFKESSSESDSAGT